MTQDELEAAGVPKGVFYAPGWTWDPAGVPRWALGAISAAVSDIGKREIGSSNDSPDLAKFATHGRPWCALAVSEWLREGLLERGGCPWGVIASAKGIRDWGVAHHALVKPENARPGDVFVILREPDPVTHEQHGHVGLIAHVADWEVFTVEGNSANAVRGGRRRLVDFTAVVRPVDGMGLV
jgi:hypothetical protein